MKPVTFDITPQEVQHYCDEHTKTPTPQLQHIERWVHLHSAYPRMVAGQFQGSFLSMISKIVQPRLVVEVGTFVGYSAICLAQGVVEGGVVHTIEVNDEIEEVIRRNIREAKLEQQVQFHIDDAREVIPTLPDEIDLAYIDADKPGTPDYYEMLLPKMRRGGVMLVDNILWSGKVLRTDLNPDADTRLLDEFNQYVVDDPRVDNILLPLRDGIMMCRVR